MGFAESAFVLAGGSTLGAGLEELLCVLNHKEGAGLPELAQIDCADDAPLADLFGDQEGR